MKIYLVGGAVRDKLLGVPVKEKDWVVVGATVPEMLKRGFRQVGKDFPVFLHPETQEEYALARVERKVQPGYQGFTFDTSTHVTLEEDLGRRDLTINAMAESEAGELIDPWQGAADLQQKLLRHVSPAFVEDPVRILRVGRLLARYHHFGFQVAPATLDLMREMVTAGEVDALVAERVWKELDRALAEPDPVCFFEVLAACGALEKLFPTVHMESKGMQALAAAATITPNAIVRFAALLHDTEDPKKNIPNLCNRYRSPNAYRNLAVLSARHHQAALNAHTFSAGQLLNLFNALDIFRREKRFEHFLSVCEAIAQIQEHPTTFDAAWLRNAATVAKSINVHELISQGLSGMALAKAIEKNRQQKIAEWLEKTH